ncbi:MAG: rod shape-determining protein RodA [Chromatiales bacterium]|nr:rod shape-determining protein RodA [Chromatiales bacterium]
MNLNPLALGRQRSAERRRGLFERLHLDLPLLMGLLTIAALGLVVLYSASGQDDGTIVRQTIRLGIAFGVMVVVAQIPPHLLRLWTPWIYGAGVILLVMVLIVGDIGKGAQRWLDLGVFRFQPSEVMKLAVPLMVALTLADGTLPPRLMGVIKSLVLLGVPALFIFMQPDLGTALLVASAGLFVLFLAGLSWKLIAAAIALVSAAAPIFWTFLMRDYQRDRVRTFLNPENDPLGSGYHIIQSKIAIGSGGLYGKGWLNGTQSHLEFLPERSTDFIFAVLAEEFGLMGILVMLAVYGFVILRGMHIASRAQDTFGRLVAGSLTLTFFVYLFVNTGMVTGILPVVGVPLPLVSYGGTSLVTLIAAFGILMSIHTHRKLLPQ